MGDEFRQLALAKKGHYYVFRYRPGEESVLIQSLASKAGDPNCELDWFDAAILSHQMGQRMAGELQAIMKGKDALA